MLGSAGAWADRPVDKQVGWFCYFSDCAGKNNLCSSVPVWLFITVELGLSHESS